MVASANRQLTRLLRFWWVSSITYVFGLILIAVEVSLGNTRSTFAVWLGAAILGNAIVFYVLIRVAERYQYSANKLAIYQAVMAIIFITCAYGIAAPVRGVTLSFLSVVLLFCAFALSPVQAYQLSLFAIFFVGIGMFAMSAADPITYPASTELVHFLAMSSVIIGVVFLIGQFNQLRARLLSRNLELEKQRVELASALERLEVIASRDELTQLVNRRQMMQLLSAEEKCSANRLLMTAVALIDIDHFKLINDRYGHEAGDEALRCFSRRVSDTLRAKDTIARWGGEEFLLMMPSTGSTVAVSVLERVRESVCASPIDVGGVRVDVTFSAGIAMLRPEDVFEDAIRRADQAMFEAKNSGRNRIRISKELDWISPVRT